MINSILGNHGPLLKFKDGDKEYRVSYLDQDKKAEFCDWVKANARAMLMEIKLILSPEDWKAEFKEYKDNLTLGKYGFHDKIAKEAMGTVEGGITLAAILFGVSREEMIDLFHRRGDEIRLLLEEIKTESSAEHVPGNGKSR